MKTVGELPPITEKAFQAQVVKFAKLHGWKSIYHTYDSRRSAQGFPDLVMVRGPKLLFVELKRDRKSPRTGAQLDWAAALKIAGQQYFFWTPEDWPEIERTLE